MTRYELLERIGVGGMAEIFRGKAVAGSGFKKDVAIKRILPHLSQDTRFVELLITEAKTLSELRHRNIVQIYDVGLGDDGQYFLVMEFVDGLDAADLFDRYERKRAAVPLDVALYTGEEVCEALEHAHAARDSEGNLVGLVHRDVSPSNILLSRSGEIKLTDFGIAKRMEELTGHGGVRGKFAYISPEQANNEHVDGRSDVCALGMVLFELITGKRLFSQMADFDALKMVRDHQIPRLSEIDPAVSTDLEAIIMKAVAPNPDDRFQSASDFASALRDFRYGMATTSGDPAQSVANLVVDNVKAREHPAPHELDPVTDLSGGGRKPATGQYNNDPEPTVVRIRSAAGFGAVSFGPADPFDAARDLLDGYSDEKTLAVGTSPPRPGREPGVDPDADTELAILDRARDEADEADFDGELETRLFDRKDPIIAAAIRGQAKRAKRPLPPPSRDEGAQTVPRAEPVVGPGPAPAPAPASRPATAAEVPARAAAAVAPRYPRASLEALRQIEHPSTMTILGMRRQTFFWVAGIAGGVLLILIIALAAGGSSSGKVTPPVDGGAAVDAGAPVDALFLAEPDARPKVDDRPAPKSRKKKRRRKRRR